MRGALLTALLILCLMMITSCSSEMGLYENALDKDREAREKLTAALNTMRDVRTMLDTATSESQEVNQEFLKQKRQEAVDAFKIAVESWGEAEDLYNELITSYPNDPVYLNNLANMLYFKAVNGLVSERGYATDLREAETLLHKAAELEEREIFKRNLELIAEAQQKAEAIRLAEENREFVRELQLLAEEANE